MNKSALEEEPQRRNSKVSNAGSRTSNTMQTCRICLGESADAEDPFFSPCQCSGTMKYIHVLCLQKWLKSKLHVKQTGFSTSIYWKTLECELCKTTYPSKTSIFWHKIILLPQAVLKLKEKDMMLLRLTDLNVDI